MTIPRFLQIHTLHSYPAALLNRDDSGLAKRMPFGDVVRTRVSSQCLKRHWRIADDEFSLKNIDGFVDAVRSRNVVTLKVMKPLREANAASEKVLQKVEAVFQEKVYSESGIQPLLLGLPEVEFLRAKAEAICTANHNNVTQAGKAAEELFHTRRGEGNNFRAFRKQTKLPGGLIGALFGRMVTSDPKANIDAAIHVAHAFTVHREESESDYFAAVEDLPTEEQGPGAAHLSDMELTSGLFYGYVVVDMPGLVSNLEGYKAGEWASADRTLAGQVVEHLVHLIATVSPGAKLGSTAPYARADLLLVEAGSRQPRSLANAFRTPVPARTKDAVAGLAEYLSEDDECYGTQESRRVMAKRSVLMDDSCDKFRAERLSLPDLAAWAAQAVRDSEVG